MLKRLLSSSRLWVCLTLSYLLSLPGHAADSPAQLLPDQLGGEQRYLAYVSTDKPIYRGGENVYLRTVILNATDNTPIGVGKKTVKITISGPNDDVVSEGYSHGTDSSIGYQWNVPKGMAGGQYTATATVPSLGIPETTRVFDIRTYRAPRLKTQVHFNRDGYGAGEQINATVSVERAEGGVPEDADVSVIARLDGEEIYRATNQRVSASGKVDAQFNLPDRISSGDGSLSFVIEDGGVVETASKTLPILLESLDITFYPESGELVAGLPSRVYFQALLPNGKPADVQGHIVEVNNGNAQAEPITTFSSEHEGRGLFAFTPEKNRQYAAIFTAPSGIAKPAELPRVYHSGTVLTSSRSAFAYAEAIELSVGTNSGNPAAMVTLHKREALLDSQDVIDDLVQLDAKDAEGVLIATAWDTKGRPLAERLVYRHPRYGLNVALSLSDGPHVPGAKVSIDVLTTDNQGNPVEAMVGITVTDDTVLELIEKRQQAPRLPAMVYLENDVLDLADAHVYLDNTDKNAATAIDLLLGTQGWRRFVLTEYADIKKQFPSQIARAMAENTQPAVVPMMNLRIAQADELQFAAPVVQALADAAAIEPEEPPIGPDAVAANPQEKLAGAVAEDAVADRGMAEIMAREAPVQANYVREFAFQARANRQPNERMDFTETLYWNSSVKTNARNGKATIEFSLSDSVTSFRVLADGYGRNGALGTGDAVIESKEPFYVATKMPLQAIAGDIIRLPVTMINASNAAIDKASVIVSGDGIADGKTSPVTLAPGQRLRQIISISTTKAGDFPIAINADAGPYSDKLTRTLSVKPAGFPISVNAGGLLSSATTFNTTVTIPENISTNSLVATATVYPSPLASMQEALNALLRQPHGCFEQTSSTNYPLVMAQQYFDTHTGVDPALIAKSRDLLKTGYSKLISFESKGNGYEWFGANPAHEALTAYGLMQFTDMSKVMQIDDSMVERTRQWLLDRRNNKGGFMRNERALDSFGRAPAPTTDAYIVWALLESGQNPDSLAREIANVKDQAFESNDRYIDALAANILYLSGDNVSAEILSSKLARASSNAGAVEGATTSITGSSGDSLTIETTSLSLLAWLRNEEQWAGQVEKSINWLFERSKSGRFGSTQSTVLALKAINSYDAARAVPKNPGAVQLLVDGQVIGEPVIFTTETKGAIELADFSHALASGQHDIELRMIDGSKMPFALEIRYNSTLPENANTRPVRIKTALSHTEVVEGEPLELQVSITAKQHNVPTPIAIIGIPAGLELHHEKLKELVGAGKISAYEVRQSELILYWRAMDAGDNRMIPVALTAQIPGKYTAPATRIYPYYTDEQKDWQAGHFIEVFER